MPCPQAHKFMLIALFSLTLTNTPTTSAYNHDKEVYFCSFLIGLIHGSLKKTSEYIDFKAKKDIDFKKDRTFEFITFVSAHMVRLQLLDNTKTIDLNTKNVASAWWHGFGQALIESYDVKTGSFSTTPVNLTLALAALGFTGITAQEFINQA